MNGFEMEELTVLHWFLLAFGALIMGMSKGGLPGAGNLTVAIYALVLEDALGPVGVPLSVGLLLPVLISADVTATLVYRRHADWKFIVRLLPFFLVGTVVGWLVFDFFKEGDDRVRLLKYVVGGILLGMTVLHFAVKFRKKKQSFRRSYRFWFFPQRINHSWCVLRFAWRSGYDACQCCRSCRTALSSRHGASKVCFYRDFGLAFSNR